MPGWVLAAYQALVGPPPVNADRNALIRLHRSGVQVLTMTRRGVAGAIELGDAIERSWMASQPRIHDWGFSVGSKLLWTRNAYDHPTGRPLANGEPETADIMNGALGVIQRSTQKGADVRFDDGLLAEMTRGDLGNVLRGWAITVHKAQGSAFEAVLIPVVRCRLLDRAMIYTAVTLGEASCRANWGPNTHCPSRCGAFPRMGWQQALDVDRAVKAARVAV